MQKERVIHMIRHQRLNLAPARWIWFPSGRTLPNTFMLFRRSFELAFQPVRASGWLAADSRYLLTVNGRRVQWGPPPTDPRRTEADPVDLARYLRPGRNVIGVQVLFYGHGEGTWVTGKPGLLARLTMEGAGGERLELITDGSWRAAIDRAHKPGQYKRWYLRSLQEEFDARRFPYGWDEDGFAEGPEWTAALELDGPPDKPALCSSYYDYLQENSVTDPGGMYLAARSIPLTVETEIAAKPEARVSRVEWLREPDDWFEFRTPGSFAPVPGTGTTADWTGKDGLRLDPLPAGQGHVVTFELEEQVVGWPCFVIEAPSGTVVELMIQEAHDPSNTTWLDTQRFAWSRLICREGANAFLPFEFESLRWFQLHIRNTAGAAVIRSAGVRRRTAGWRNAPSLTSTDGRLGRLLEASINTVLNNAQETIVDGMGRERQQYSGDLGHVLQTVRYLFGDTSIPARFLRTYGEGITDEGYFLDCWPGYDRMARIPQRMLGISEWGPILDHGVQFAFDCWNHYLETGDTEEIAGLYPRLARFADYLTANRGEGGLVPVEGLGIPIVWIDHTAYKRQRHKLCAFNLHIAAMLTHAMAPLAELFGDDAGVRRYLEAGGELLASVTARFWSETERLFAANLPWADEEGELRLCDRSLALSILFGQCPSGDTAAAAGELREPSGRLGLSYPANAGWRLHALAQEGWAGEAVRELKVRWADMPSVRLNRTLSEFWSPVPDTNDQWSHGAVAPLNVMVMDIAGIRPAAPGYAAVKLCPQFEEVGELSLTAHTVKGPIRVEARPEPGGGYRARLVLPAGMRAEFVYPAGARDCAKTTAGCESVYRYTLRSGTPQRITVVAGEAGGGEA